MTVRLKVGSTSWMTRSHSELAHSTDDCCRNRISLEGQQAGGKEAGSPRFTHIAAERGAWRARGPGACARPNLWEGAACWRTIRMMSSGVESASPLRPLRMKPGVSMMVRLAQ